MADKIFECHKCGHCCEGRGGIILSPRDLSRLADFLRISRQDAVDLYGEVVNGKLRLKAGADGDCIFLVKGQGCSVHAGKPDICRAWPYFRGNLEDPASLAMAKDFCPGINPDASFENFVAEGIKQLLAEGLPASDGVQAANSLVIDDLPVMRNLRKQENQTWPDAPAK